MNIDTNSGQNTCLWYLSACALMLSAFMVAAKRADGQQEQFVALVGRVRKYLAGKQKASCLITRRLADVLVRGPQALERFERQLTGWHDRYEESRKRMTWARDKLLYLLALLAWHHASSDLDDREAADLVVDVLNGVYTGPDPILWSTEICIAYLDVPEDHRDLEKLLDHYFKSLDFARQQWQACSVA